MADDMAQRLLMLGPVVEDRPAVEPDHVGQPGDVVVAAERQSDALKQAEQVEFALAPSFPRAPRRSGNRRHGGSRPRTAREIPQAGARKPRAPWLPFRPARALWSFSTSCLLIAFSSEVGTGSREENASDKGFHGFPRVPTGFAVPMQLTSARQSETLRPPAGLGGRDDADCDGGNIGCFGRAVAARGGRAGANRGFGGQDRTGGADRHVGTTAPPRDPARAGVSARRSGDPPVYPQYNPGPNAVRDCTATYVQEYRPSGTVITPRMHCYWRRG